MEHKIDVNQVQLKCVGVLIVLIMHLNDWEHLAKFISIQNIVAADSIKELHSAMSKLFRLLIGSRT